MMWTLAIALLLLIGYSDALTCFCSDCPTHQCSGDHCTAEASFNHEVGEIVHSSGCLQEDSANLCNITSGHNTVNCCSTGDLCNQGVIATLLPTRAASPIVPVLERETHGITDISHVTMTPTAGQATTTPTAEQATTVETTETSTTTPTLVYPPTPSSGGNCIKSDSSRSDTVFLCPLTTECYSMLRRKTLSNGTKIIVKKRGCSRGPCVEETRNRKVKRCCSTSLCNVELFYEDYFPTAEPQPATTTQVTTTPTDTTDTTDSTPTKIRPNIRPPILTPLMITTGTPQTTEQAQLKSCHCNAPDCSSPTCGSLYGCVSTFTLNAQDQTRTTSVVQTCMDESTICDTVSMTATQFTLCCFSDYCNDHEGTPTRVLPATTDVTEDHMTSGDPSITEPLAKTTPDLLIDITTGRPPTSHTTPSQVTPHIQDLQELYFTIGTIIFIVIGAVIIVIFLIILTACCLKHRKTSSKHKIELVRPMTLERPPSSCHSNKYGSSGDMTSERTSSQSSDSPSVKSGSSDYTHSSTSV